MVSSFSVISSSLSPLNLCQTSFFLSPLSLSFKTTSTRIRKRKKKEEEEEEEP